jgi:hypothetical protein
MTRTIEDLTEDFAAKKENAEFWLQARDDADSDRMFAHLRFIEASREVDEALSALIAAQGEPS